MDSLFQDLKVSARVLRRAPGFTIVAALTLAIGIGANASIFSLVNGLVLKAPAGIHDPDRLVQIARSYETDPRWDNFSWPALQLIASESPALWGVAGHQASAFVLGRGAETESVVGEFVTGTYFETLGVRPQLGRAIGRTDDLRPGAHPVVVLGHGLWTRRFGADPSVVGSTVQIGAHPYEVIGVAPEGFAGVESLGAPPELFVPASMHPGIGGRLPFDQWGTSWIEAFGRLAEGVAFEEAEASMGVISARLRNAASVNDEILVLLAPGVGLDPEARDQARQISAILLLIVGLVLLLTCTNVANLCMSRAAVRQTEVGVRLALGAGRLRLIRQLITESFLLSLAATLLAVPMVHGAGDILPLVFPYALSVSLDADTAVYAFLVGIGLLTGLLFGMVPAIASTRRGLTGALRTGAVAGAPARTRLRDLLVVAQLGLSLGLVAGAALLGKSVQNARLARPGFEPAGLVAGFLDLRGTGRYDEQSGRAFQERVLAELRRTPGVEAVTFSNQIPIAGGHSRATARPAGRPDVAFEAEYVIVGPDYFRTLGIPILGGRPLGGIEDEPERVVVVNEALAERFWPGQDPIGQELAGEPNWRVVGVAGNVQMRSLRSAANPAVYYPASMAYSSGMALQARAREGRSVLPTALREAVAAVDPELPVSRVVDVEGALAQSMGETRTIGGLVGIFAALALVLAAVGLYGLVSYGVSQRVREIGIRVALGAEPGSVTRLLLARGVRISLVGIAVGLVVSFALGQALQGLLFGVSPTDLVTLLGAAAVLMTAAALAAWVPARKASRVDAAISLRNA